MHEVVWCPGGSDTLRRCPGRPWRCNTTQGAWTRAQSKSRRSSGCGWRCGPPQTPGAPTRNTGPAAPASRRSGRLPAAPCGQRDFPMRQRHSESCFFLCATASIAGRPWMMCILEAISSFSKRLNRNSAATFCRESAEHNMPRTPSSRDVHVFPCSKAYAVDTAQDVQGRASVCLAAATYFSKKMLASQPSVQTKRSCHRKMAEARVTRQTQLTLCQGLRCAPFDHDQIQRGGDADHEQATIDFDFHAASLHVVQDFLWRCVRRHT